MLVNLEFVCGTRSDAVLKPFSLAQSAISMSANRVVTEQTLALFRASEAGDAKAVEELVRHPNTDLNWHRTQSVR